MKPTAPRLPVARGPNARASWPFISAFAALPASLVGQGGADSEPRASGAGGRAALAQATPDGNHGDNTSSATPVRLEMTP
jgi:hypothetical protein